VFAEVEGTISEEHTSDNEDIQAALYSRQEVSRLLENETFSSRAQIAAYMFSIGALDVNTDR
jgi:ADP-ribose pyrophosphatase